MSPPQRGPPRPLLPFGGQGQKQKRCSPLPTPSAPSWGDSVTADHTCPPHMPLTWYTQEHITTHTQGIQIMQEHMHTWYSWHTKSTPLIASMQYHVHTSCTNTISCMHMVKMHQVVHDTPILVLLAACIQHQCTRVHTCVYTHTHTCIHAHPITSPSSGCPPSLQSVRKECAVTEAAVGWGRGCTPTTWHDAADY